MIHESFPSEATDRSNCSRRRFLGAVGAAAAAGPLWGAAAGFAADQTEAAKLSDAPKRKIKLGLIGCGGRGSWITPLFSKHGGYEWYAAADYFPENVDRWGKKHGVPKERRFSGLSGYKRVIESGVEAVAVIVPPYFASHHTAAAAEAGLHVYVAKPTAIDVAGCRRLEAAGKLATEKKRVFFVDYQMHTDPGNIEVARRIRAGGLGKIAKIVTVGINGGRSDPPKTATIESRLQHAVWDSDIELGGDFIVEYDIHAIDAALWLLGRHPVAAMGCSSVCRPNPHGDSHDSCAVVFEYADGLIHEHSGLALPTGVHDDLSCAVYGQTGYGMLSYTDKARFQPRKKTAFVKDVVNLYTAGAERNVASFYRDVTEGNCENPTVQRAVNGCLTCILGREAAIRHRHLTLEELLQENRRLEPDLSGLKV